MANICRVCVDRNTVKKCHKLVKIFIDDFVYGLKSNSSTLDQVENAIGVKELMNDLNQIPTFMFEYLFQGYAIRRFLEEFDIPLGTVSHELGQAPIQVLKRKNRQHTGYSSVHHQANWNSSYWEENFRSLSVQKWFSMAARFRRSTELLDGRSKQCLT
jgi:hypothetical protein